MKFESKSDLGSAEGDMTPMIDMTFQLIAFFMILINFNDDNLLQQIRLPGSELARPADGAYKSSVVLQIDRNNVVLHAGSEYTVDQMDRPLLVERRVIEDQKKSVADTTVVIRADLDAKTGEVQRLIQKCQEHGFETFVLRAKQKTPGT